MARKGNPEGSEEPEPGNTEGDMGDTEGITMPGGSTAPPAWPGDEFAEGSRLVGTVAYSDPKGGTAQRGSIDVDTDDEHRYRFYVNQPAERILSEAMRKANVRDWKDMEGRTIVVIFVSWEKSARGRKYRTFGIGFK